MNDPSIATAADYADALITARKAKNGLWVALSLIILVHLLIFFLARYRLDLSEPRSRNDLLCYWIGLADFAALVIALILGIDLLLIIGIMLIGRLIGVSHLIRAFLWNVVLLVLVFPWQAFLINATFTSTEFKIPGVMYTWPEIVLRSREMPAHFSAAWLLFWARFVVWPIVALIILAGVQLASRRGLRLALGETASLQPPHTSADKVG